MGAPKQKWTAEEEAALKAGVVKHGAGKWRTILIDPEFNGVLCLRSNVDLKDKWRNLSVTANGWGSREKARTLKRSRQTLRHDGSSKAVGTMYEDADAELMESKSLATANEMRIDNLILEAIINLKEPTGSNKTAIATYIEDQYWPPPEFAELLSDKLKELTATGRLIRVKHKYRIAPTSSFPRGKTSKFMNAEVRQTEPSGTIRDDPKPSSRFQVDAELARMQSMTAQQAAAVAAQAVAEAEAAMAEAEAAAREAEAAEADAEAAQAFVEAVTLTMKNKNTSNLMQLAKQKELI